MTAEEKNNTSFLNIFIAPVGTGDVGIVENRERMKQIRSSADERVSRERYRAWLLLDHALHFTLGIGTADAALSLHGQAWQSEKCCLSISHGGGFVAVALSSESVGIDIESVRDNISDGFAKRYLTEREYGEYNGIDEQGRADFFVEKWTAKESIFKHSGKEYFTPSSIETADHAVKTCHLSVLGTDVVLSVCSGILAAARLTVVDCGREYSEKIYPFVD